MLIYHSKIKKENFENELICLGSQLAQIATSAQVKDAKWIIFDVFATSSFNMQELFPAQNGVVEFLKYGKFISALKQVMQFENGVFCLVPKSYVHDNTMSPPYTEAEETLQIPSALLEVRAFDYSYFELYSKSKDIIKQIVSTLPNPANITVEVID